MNQYFSPKLPNIETFDLLHEFGIDSRLVLFHFTSFSMNSSVRKNQVNKHEELYSAICEMTENLTFDEFIKQSLPLGFNYTSTKNLALGLHSLEAQMFESISNLVKLVLSRPEIRKSIKGLYYAKFEEYYEDIKFVFFYVLDYLLPKLNKLLVPMGPLIFDGDALEQLIDENQDAIMKDSQEILGRFLRGFLEFGDQKNIMKIYLSTFEDTLNLFINPYLASANKQQNYNSNKIRYMKKRMKEPIKEFLCRLKPEIRNMIAHRTYLIKGEKILYYNQSKPGKHTKKRVAKTQKRPKTRPKISEIEIEIIRSDAENLNILMISNAICRFNKLFSRIWKKNTDNITAYFLFKIDCFHSTDFKFYNEFLLTYFTKKTKRRTIYLQMKI